MVASGVKSAEDLKEAGNDLFKVGDYQASLDAYTAALELDPDAKLKAILYRNRAMVRLKTEDFEGAECDCDRAIEIEPGDAKALYRRALAREKLDKVGSAFKDAKEALRLQPGDKVVEVLCENLLRVNTERLKKAESTENKVTEMLKLSFGGDNEQQLKAMNNLLVLCRDSEDGARRVWQEGKILPQLLQVLNDKAAWSDELALCAVRILDELTKRRERVCLDN